MTPSVIPPASALHRLRCRLVPVGQWCVTLALFSVPINKPLTSSFVVLAMITSLLGAAPLQRWKQAFHDPVARGMLVWAGVLLLSALHALALGDSGRGLMRSDIWNFIIPLMVASLLQTPQLRWRALYAFAAGIGVVLLVSWLMAIGLVPQREIAELVVSMRNTVIKEYTQQGLATLMLFSLMLAIWPTLRQRRWRIAALVVAGLALVNVAVLLGSRTSYLTLVPLVLYWAWVVFSRPTAKLRVLLVAGVFALGLGVSLWNSPSMETRLNAVTDEVSSYVEDGSATSTGIRLWLWQHTGEMIAEAPLIGHGLGQWHPQYLQRMQQIPDSRPYLTSHPHQEMLLVLAEEGALGLAVMLVLLFLLLRLLLRLPAPEKHFFVSVLIIYLTAGLANGLVSDYTHRNTFLLLLSCIPTVSLLAAGRTVEPSRRELR